MTFATLQKVVQRLGDLDQQKAELSAAIGEWIPEQKQAVLGNNLHWSRLYKYSYPFTLLLFLFISGFLKVIYRVVKRKPKDVYAAIDQELSKIEDYQGGPWGLFKERHFIKFFYPILKSAEAMSLYGATMDQLLKKAKYDDEALFKAVRVDRSVITYPGIAARIARAEMEGDEKFFNDLGTALKAKKAKAQEYAYLRIILAALQQASGLESLTMKEAYELLAVELKLYPQTGESPDRSLWQLINRWKEETALYLKK